MTVNCITIHELFKRYLKIATPKPKDSFIVLFFCYLHSDTAGPGHTIVGWELKTHRQKRTEFDRYRHVFVSNKQIQHIGVVTEWTYMSTTTNPFKGIIWRHRHNHYYEVVGVNDIPGGPSDENITYNVPEEDRIDVKTGDLLGFAYITGGVFWVDQNVGSERSFIRTYSYPVDEIIKSRILAMQHWFHRAYSLQITVESGEWDQVLFWNFVFRHS